MLWRLKKYITEKGKSKCIMEYGIWFLIVCMMMMIMSMTTLKPKGLSTPAGIVDTEIRSAESAIAVAKGIVYENQQKRSA